MKMYSGNIILSLIIVLFPEWYAVNFFHLFSTTL